MLLTGISIEKVGEGAVLQGPVVQTRALEQLPADKQGWHPSPSLPLVRVLLLSVENSLKIELDHEKKIMNAGFGRQR